MRDVTALALGLVPPNGGKMLIIEIPESIYAERMKRFEHSIETCRTKNDMLGMQLWEEMRECFKLTGHPCVPDGYSQIKIIEG